MLYDHPANLFVAGFIGSPAMNLVEAELAERNGGLAARFGPHELGIPAEVAAARPLLRGYAGRRIALGIRPEDIEDAPGPAETRLAVTVDIREDMGSEVFLHFAVDAPPVKAEELRELVGDEERSRRPRCRPTTTAARSSRRSGEERRRARAGEQAMNARLLHFFDLETGSGIYA